MKSTTELQVEGMSCGHCVNAVKNLINEVEGVETAEVDLASKTATISFEADATSAEAIIDNINSSEVYKATVK
jgi:copper chaperone